MFLSKTLVIFNVVSKFIIKIINFMMLKAYTNSHYEIFNKNLSKSLLKHTHRDSSS